MVWLYSLPCYTHLKLALLLHKQGLVATGVATTVGVAHYKNVARSLSTRGIHTTYQQFQMLYIFVLAQWDQKSPAIEFKCVEFLSKIDFTFLLDFS